MADDLQFDPYRFIASQNKLNFAKDELESFMAKVTEAELFIMPKDMPCKILLNKHLKTLEKYPANLNDWDIKMSDFKNMISTLDATFAEQLGVDNSAKNVTEELSDIESELETLNEKYDEYMSKVTQYASRREAYPATEEDKIMISRKKELEARQAEINGTLHIEEDKWYEDIGNAGKTLFKSAEDVVDSVLKGDKDSIIENSIDFGVQLKATEAVVDTSVVSGVGKIVEGILDGVGVVLTGVASIPTGILDGGIYLLSKAANIEFESTTKKMWEQTMDDVARDKVGEINDSFYTDTLLGQTINDNSALKYDGAGAEAIQTGAKFAGEVALFTVSGGTLAPVLGGLESLGESAQNEYQKEDRRIFTPRMAVETAGGVFKGIMYNRIGTNILKLGQLGVKQGVATVVDNAKASIAKAGFKGIFKHAFWSKDALQDVVFTTLQKGAEVYIGYDESDSKTWEEYKNSGELNWGNVILSTVTEILSGRFSDTLLGLARGDEWNREKVPKVPKSTIDEPAYYVTEWGERIYTEEGCERLFISNNKSELFSVLYGSEYDAISLKYIDRLSNQEIINIVESQNDSFSAGSLFMEDAYYMNSNVKGRVFEIYNSLPDNLKNKYNVDLTTKEGMNQIADLLVERLFKASTTIKTFENDDICKSFLKAYTGQDINLDKLTQLYGIVKIKESNPLNFSIAKLTPKIKRLRKCDVSFWSYGLKTIFIDEDSISNGKTATLIHEVGHTLLDSKYNFDSLYTWRNYSDLRKAYITSETSQASLNLKSMIDGINNSKYSVDRLAYALGGMDEYNRRLSKLYEYNKKKHGNFADDTFLYTVTRVQLEAQISSKQEVGRLYEYDELYNANINAASDFLQAVLGKDIVKTSYGHSVEYFSKPENCIHEAFAEYTVLRNSPSNAFDNGEQILKKLKLIVGDDIMNMLEERYNKVTNYDYITSFI